MSGLRRKRQATASELFRAIYYDWEVSVQCIQEEAGGRKFSNHKEHRPRDLLQGEGLRDPREHKQSDPKRAVLPPVRKGQSLRTSEEPSAARETEEEGTIQQGRRGGECVRERKEQQRGRGGGRAQSAPHDAPFLDLRAQNDVGDK